MSSSHARGARATIVAAVALAVASATALALSTAAPLTGIRTMHSLFGGRAVDGFDAIDTQSRSTRCRPPTATATGRTSRVRSAARRTASSRASASSPCACSIATAAARTRASSPGINWVTGNHQPGQPAVANMSLGGSASSSLHQAVHNSIADVYALAAGNDNTNACNQSPGRTAEALTVGATTSTYACSSFSNSTAPASTCSRRARASPRPGTYNGTAGTYYVRLFLQRVRRLPGRHHAPVGRSSSPAIRPGPLL